MKSTKIKKQLKKIKKSFSSNFSLRKISSNILLSKKKKKLKELIN
jgi:hypothetical protein